MIPAIMDILIRFRAYKYEITADIEKAFLQVNMSEDQRDFTRFLWFRDPTVDFDELELIVLRFTKLVFGINVSPFLLNATLRHHISEYSKEDIEFATKLIKSLYVDHVNTGSNSAVKGFEFYKKAKTCLGFAMFNLQKWASNSEELMDLIRREREQRDLQAEPAVIDKPDSVSDNMINDPEDCKTVHVTQDSVTFAKVSVGPELQEIDSSNQVKILGNRWDFREDLLTFDFQSLVEFARELSPTTRNIIRIYSKVFDPVGVISPIFVVLKLMFRRFVWNDMVGMKQFQIQRQRFYVVGLRSDRV